MIQKPTLSQKKMGGKYKNFWTRFFPSFTFLMTSGLSKVYLLLQRVTSQKWVKASFRICLYLFFLIVLFGCTYSYIFASTSLSICTITHNDSRFLREWVEYHRLIGCDKFYVYDCESQDDTYQILEPYIRSGVVKFIPWFSSEMMDEKEFNAAIFNHYLSNYATKYQWGTCLKPLYYINPHVNENLKEFFAPCKHIGGVAVFKQKFGTNFVKKLGKRQLIIETFTQKAPTYDPMNFSHVIFFRPKHVVQINPRELIYEKGYYTVNEHLNPLSMEIFIDKIQCNDYTFLDEENLQKIAVSKKWDPLYLNYVRNHLNRCEDSTILRFSLSLRKSLGYPLHGSLLEPHEIEEMNKEKIPPSRKDSPSY